MKTIRASEIGSYLYCQRAWWYHRLGYVSKNQAELTSGQEIHTRHGRNLFTAGILRMLAFGLFLVALLLFVAYLTT